MKDEKRVQDPVETEEEQKLLRELTDGLHHLDDSLEVYTPGVQWFERFVEEQEKRILARRNRDLLLFVATALAILTVSMTVFYMQPIAYWVLQGLAVVVPPLLFVVRKRVNDHNEHNLS